MDTKLTIEPDRTNFLRLPSSHCHIPSCSPALPGMTWGRTRTAGAACRWGSAGGENEHHTFVYLMELIKMLKAKSGHSLCRNQPLSVCLRPDRHIGHCAML